MEKNRVFEFIQNWVTNDRGEKLILEKSKTIENGKWFGFHTKGGIVYVAIHESQIPLWYKRFMFDKSMDKKQKNELLNEFPMQKEIEKHFGKYTIDGEIFYIKRTQYY
jgi:hypothetical protein